MWHILCFKSKLLHIFWLVTYGGLHQTSPSEANLITTEYSTCSLNIRTDVFVKGMCVSQKWHSILMAKALSKDIRDLGFQPQSLLTLLTCNRYVCMFMSVCLYVCMYVCGQCIYRLGMVELSSDKLTPQVNQQNLLLHSIFPIINLLNMDWINWSI